MAFGRYNELVKNGVINDYDYKPSHIGGDQLFHQSALITLEMNMEGWIKPVKKWGKNGQQQKCGASCGI